MIIKQQITKDRRSSMAQLSTSNLLAGSAVSRPKCVELRGLSPGQARICELFRDHMPAVGRGAKEAINECEHQFKNHRWNCSTPPEAGIYGPVHKMGTREAAFTYAMLSAGVTHEIGRRCRLGMLKSCGCSEAPKPVNVNKDWTWGGCGDNVDYGYRFSKDFIDVREKEEGFKRSDNHGRSLMNRWNNEIGRKILKRQTRPKCKCHGVSGSCNLKTCWMQLPNLRQIGNILQAKYRTARRIQINARGNMQFEDEDTPYLKKNEFNFEMLSRKNQKRQIFNRQKKRSLTDLVYLEDSPDYCKEDRSQGTPGTKGRKCTKDRDALNSCDLLCCGRGYDSYTKEVVTKCDCKFQWCCQVVCQTCRQVTQIHICKKHCRMKLGLSRLFELQPDPYDYTKKEYLRICLFTNVKNAKELCDLVRKNLIDVAIIKAELVTEPFVLLAAANRTLHQSAHDRLSARSLAAELIYSLSPSRNIAESLATFGISENCRNLIVVTFNDESGKEMIKVAKKINGTPVPLETMRELSDLLLIKKIYQITEPEFNAGTISDLIVSKMVSKDLTL